MKSKLPFGKKAKDEVDEEIIEDNEESDSQQGEKTDATDISELEHESENKSLVHKIKSKLSGLGKKKPEDTSDDDEASQKKKKNSKVIQFAIVGGLVVFLAWDYIFPPDEEPSADQVASSFKRPNRKKPKKAEPAPSDRGTTPSETAASTTVTGPESPVEVTATETTPTETPSTTEPTPTDTTTALDATATPDTTTTTTPDTTATTTPDTTATTTPDTTATTTPDATTSIIPDTDETTIEPSTIGSTTPSTDIVDDTVSKTGDNLTDQILKDLESQAKATPKPQPEKKYVAPPDYEYTGKGLVYNCVGKHWACVDGPSYKICENNSSYLKHANKNVECHPYNVYETVKGCENMQNRMVSSGTKTAFCN